MAHTPGPWRAHRPGEWDDPSEYWEIDDQYGHTATVYGDDAEAEANARLIAAAPELLAACKALMQSPIYTDEVAANQSLGRAAIAKAEGRA